MIQNLQLLAHENGIGMVWKSGRIMYDKQVHQDFGLADNERFAAIIQTGYPDEQPKAKERTPAKACLPSCKNPRLYTEAGISY